MHPVLLEVPTPWGPLPIQSYGTMLGLSLLLGWLLLRRLGGREGLPPELLSTAFVVSAVLGLVGARLLYVLTNPTPFAATPLAALNLRMGGLVAYGGFLGGLLGAWIVLRRRGVSLLAFADVATPGLALGLGITRIGCYLYGCDYGRPLGAGAPAWLQALGRFPRWHDHAGSPAFLQHVATRRLDPFADASLPVHPTQLYESAVGFGLFALALVLLARRRFGGQVFLAIAALYGTLRFFLEVLRDDPERGGAFGLSTSQLIGLTIVPLAAFLYLQLWRDAPPPAVQAPEEAEEGEDDGDEDEVPEGPRRRRRRPRAS